MKRYKHGHCENGRLTPEFHAWTSMRYRCRNPRCDSYPRYGGRGITVCDRWDSFEAFLADMGPRPTAKHSIDRIDNDGPYSPANCRWALIRDQRRNRSDVRLYEHAGKRMCLADWARVAGLSLGTLQERIYRGWPLQKAIEAPLRGELG